MSNEMRDLVDGLLAYALRFARTDDTPTTGDCWDLIAQARRYLRETESTGAPAPGEDMAQAGRDALARRSRALQALRDEGLSLGECIRAFAVSEDDPYVAAARTAVATDDDMEIDDRTSTSVGDGGAWVLAWLWIGHEQAGVLSNSAMLEEVLRCAGEALTGAHGLDDEAAWLRENQVVWLDELLANHAERIDAIESARPTAEPGAVLWVDEHGHDLWFVPSEAVLHLLALARRAGLKGPVAEHCERFCAQHGQTLDAHLSVIRLG